MHKVFVTGMGIVSAAGNDCETFKHSLYHGNTGITQVSGEAAEVFSDRLNVAALLNGFNFDEQLSALTSRFESQGKMLPEEVILLSRKSAKRSCLTIQASVLAALQAWHSAGLISSDTANHSASDSASSASTSASTSIVVAGQNLSQATSYTLQNKYSDQLDFVPPQFGLQFMDTYLVGALSEIFKIHGEGFSIGGASASGNMGLIQACRLIQWGLAERVLVVGALAEMSPLELQAWRSLGALAYRGEDDPQAEQMCRPFDSGRKGFVYGQGAAALVLESEKSIHTRIPENHYEDAVIARIVGMATCLDGNRLSNPNQAGESRVMQEALAQAKLTPNDVQYINAHGTASHLGDEVECAAIADVFSENKKNLKINSTKAITGHCLFSAGLVESVATLIQMKNGFVHPNINLQTPIDSTLNFVGQKSEKQDINVAMNNSFGFGGINTSVVFAKY